MRSIIFGWGFICRAGLFQFIDYLKHLVALFDRFVNHEAQMGSVFESDSSADEALDVFAMMVELTQAFFLLFGVAQDANTNNCGMQISADANVINRDQAHLGDRKFTANDFADFTF